jgi:hypothetical protein
MREMIFGEAPTFRRLLEVLREIDSQVNEGWYRRRDRPDRFVADKERRRFEGAVGGAAAFEEMPDRYRQLPGGAASCPAFACNEEVSMTAWPVYGHAPASTIAFCYQQASPRQAIGPGRLAKNERVPFALLPFALLNLQSEIWSRKMKRHHFFPP